MSQYVIDIRDLCFEYDKNDPLFNRLNMAVKSGQTIGIVGSNGAGKSTLLKLMVGLESGQSGSIMVSNIEVAPKTIQTVRQKIGFAFQNAESQLFMTTVYEDVAFGPRNQGLDEEEVDRIVKESLAKVDAGYLIDRPPYKLSGGEKRVAALATVLSMKPDVIVLDEPTTGLDPRARRQLIKLLNDLPQTKVITTHDMDMALEICDEVVVMHRGEIVGRGKPREIFTQLELLDSCRLEQPLSMQACPVCNRLANGG